jgi:hypothetical protein
MRVGGGEQGRTQCPGRAPVFANCAHLGPSPSRPESDENRSRSIASVPPDERRWFVAEAITVRTQPRKSKQSSRRRWGSRRASASPGIVLRWGISKVATRTTY